MKTSLYQKIWITFMILLLSTLAISQTLTEIERDSKVHEPHLLLREIGQDFSRLTFENTASPGKFWTLAAQAQSGGISQTNFYYYNGTSGKDIMSITSDGRVGINRFDPFVALHVNGFTKLGNESPRIKMKTITGSTPNCTECTLNVDHGISDRKKIISVDIFVDFDFNNEPGSDFSYSTPVGYHYLDASTDRYYYKIFNNHIRIYNNLSNIAQANKPYRMVITYTE